ncbi:hypothetical protein KM900_16590 [Bacillus subtilis]|uniref:CHC2 zinc finger domain-containing protein n=1 Tax=Bacillus subtilis TaxID=1423 RepID=UPI001C23C638|nr:hypothetical protein [Bacillus subtilis]MBU8624987.1 hypothetical protein [Bacillus subtilis]
MSVIDLIKNSIPIMNALERYTGVKFLNTRTNRRQFNIRCPYHNDRNPSLTVYTETNTFRCWSGCNNGRSGSVIDIVMLSRNVNIKDAIKLLIADYELEISKVGKVGKVGKWQKKREYRKQSVLLLE